MFQRLIDATQEMVSPVTEILPPVRLLERCRHLAATHDHVTKRIIGVTGKGNPIEAYDIGSGTRDVLLYGFPDPGEAVGGTGALMLMHALLHGNPYLHALDVSWHIIPCLNFDDQPHHGQKLCAVQHDPNDTFVDFCLPEPRPETTALLEYAQEFHPVFTFALHDEFHSGELCPVYFPISRVLTPPYCHAIRDCIEQAGYSIGHAYDHTSMGHGFFDMREQESYAYSTFSVLAEYGLVFLCEVSQHPDLKPSAVVGTQLCAGLIAAMSVLE